MIENEHQYLVTLQRITTFEQALVKLNESTMNGQPLHPRQLQARREARQSQLEDLRAEIAEYDLHHPDMGILHKQHSLTEITSAVMEIIDLTFVTLTDARKEIEEILSAAERNGWDAVHLRTEEARLEQSVSRLQEIQSLAEAMVVAV